MSNKITNKEKLFNPNYTFVGNSIIILKNYPARSKNLERFAYSGVNAKGLNPKFIKDGYMYLMRGAKNGQESGFFSRKYANKETIENLNLDPNKVAYAQSINGNTPFISATTDIYTAASFSQKQRIYVIKIPVRDVYTFYKDEFLLEDEYMIPDYISSSEIIGSFRYEKFKQIYNFLTKEIGLDLTPEDIGATMETINVVDIGRIERSMYFNNSGTEKLDSLLTKIQEDFLSAHLDEHFSLTQIDINQNENLKSVNDIYNDSKCKDDADEVIFNMTDVSCKKLVKSIQKIH